MKPSSEDPPHAPRRRAPLRAALVLLLSSCTAATGSFEGGQAKFDAAPPEPTPGADRGDNGTGITWTDLYREYFGPGAAASCAGTGACHGGEGQPGFKSSRYLCSDKDQCWASMRDKDGDAAKHSGLVKESDLGMPESSQLLAIELRHDAVQADGTTKRVGSMPKNPQYTFTPVGLARIRDWAKAGGKND